MTPKIFAGVVPALMTPCKADRSPDFDALVRKGQELMAAGMTAVVYCGSMGDWPLLSDAQRMEGVERLTKAGVPVIVGTGAINTAHAVALAEHAGRVGAAGLMLNSARAVARQFGHCTAKPLQGDPFRRPWIAGGHLQQPLLRLRNPGRTLLRATRRASESRRF